MKLFGEASKYIDFSNSKHQDYTASSDGSVWYEDIAECVYKNKTYTMGIPYKRLYMNIVNRMIHTPLTIEALEDNTEVWYAYKNSQGNRATCRIIGTGSVIEDSIVSTSVNTLKVSLTKGSKVQYFCDGTGRNTSVSTTLDSNKAALVYGNVLSLIDSYNFGRETNKTLNNNAFDQLLTFSELYTTMDKPIVLSMSNVQTNAYVNMLSSRITNIICLAKTGITTSNFRNWISNNICGTVPLCTLTVLSEFKDDILSMVTNCSRQYNETGLPYGSGKFKIIEINEGDLI